MDRRYKNSAARLHSPERLARLQVEQVVEAALQGIAARSVLDVGVGTGLFAEAFLARGLKVTGVDVNPAMLEITRERLPGLGLAEGEAEQLPFSAGEFDLAFLGHVLHEVESVETALREAGRVARQRVVVLEWPYRQEETGPPLEHRLTVEAMREAGLAAGFAAVEQLPHPDMLLLQFTPAAA